jgi:serine/threonine protein phosphatase PrpC
MVERKPFKAGEYYRRAKGKVVDVFTRRKKEDKTPEALHPLVAEYATFRHAKNDPDQDADADFPEKGLFVVADGVGSEPGSENASALACKTILETWKTAAPSEELSLSDTITLMRSSIVHAQEAIVGEGQSDPTRRKIATTVVAAKLWQSPTGEKKVIFGWVGDSKGAILRKNGTLDQVTVDDDAVSYYLSDPEQIKALHEKIGNANSYDEFGNEPIVHFTEPEPFLVYRNGRVEQDDVTSLTEQDFFANRNMTETLGVAYHGKVNLAMRTVSAGDQIVLLTDGVSDNNTHDQREAILSGEGGVQEKAQKLGDAAVTKSQEVRTTNNIRSKFDDMRAKLIKVA